jgi:hypothetical protein
VLEQDGLPLPAPPHDREDLPPGDLQAHTVQDRLVVKRFMKVLDADQGGLPSEKPFGEKVVAHEDEHGRHNHGLGGCRPHAFGAFSGGVPLVAADHRQY